MTEPAERVRRTPGRGAAARHLPAAVAARRPASSATRPTGSSTSSPRRAARSGRCCRWCRRTRRAARRTTRRLGDGRQPRADQPRPPVRAGSRRPVGAGRAAAVRLRAWCARAGRLAGAVRRVHHPARAARPRSVADVGAGAAGPRPGARRARRSRRTPTGCRSCASSSGSSPSSGARCGRTPRAQGVLFFGDLPIFVSHDSADVWASRELFRLDARRPADHGDRRAAGLLRRRRPALEQPALRLGRDGRRRVRLVAAPDRPPAGAVRPRPHRPLPRLRGGLARAGRGRDRPGRLLGDRARGARSCRAGRDRRARHAGRRGPRRDHAGGRGAARPSSGCPG